MRDQTLVAGLDIGSTEIRLVVGQTTGGQLQIIGAVSAPAAGISKGIVNNIEEVASSVMACLEKSERLIGVRVDSVYIGVSAPSLKCERSKGVVAINQMNNEVLMMMLLESLRPLKLYRCRLIMKFCMLSPLNIGLTIKMMLRIRLVCRVFVWRLRF